MVTAGVTAGVWTVDSSWFRGREPDENRTDLDLGPLDSYSVRLGWAHGPWSAQASGAALTMPEAVTRYDAKKLSASVSYEQPDRLSRGPLPSDRTARFMALTMGYIRDFWTTPDARVGVGGDVTGYLVPDNLREAYGAPVSFHVFLRYRGGPIGRTGVTHVH